MSNQAVIIKKVKKGGHGAHHGGAWKVAYADFVTAMMAFFLLLWLISMTTPEQKKGIADYFAPPNVSVSTSGAGGILGGTALDNQSAKMSGSSTNATVPSQGRSMRRLSTSTPPPPTKRTRRPSPATRCRRRSRSS